jgi:peptidoglycan/LPS O-acetylase OafA/YrhL
MRAGYGPLSGHLPLVGERTASGEAVKITLYAGAVTVRPPNAVRRAGFIVVAQGVAGLVIAAILVIRGLSGADQRVVNGLGTAVWFMLVGAGVLAGGWALVTGRRWGRGLAVFTQLLLLPVAWYLAVGSHRLAFGIPLGLLALITLGLLFSASAVRWAAGGDQPGPASAVSSEPDTR